MQFSLGRQSHPELLISEAEIDFSRRNRQEPKVFCSVISKFLFCNFKVCVMLFQNLTYVVSKFILCYFKIEITFE